MWGLLVYLGGVCVGDDLFCAFLHQIYEAQPEISAVFQSDEMIPLPRLLSMIMVISVPPVCNRVFFTQGLNVSHLINFMLFNASAETKSTCINLLHSWPTQQSSLQPCP